MTAACFDVTTMVAPRRVLDIICNALDSGAFRYWIDPRTLREEFPEGWTLDSVEWLEGADREFWRGCARMYFAPLIEGGALVFALEDDDGTTVPGGVCVLDRASVRRGLQAMASKYPRHFADLVGENDDANTADVFVQCCVLGEVVYG